MKTHKRTQEELSVQFLGEV